jgi:hypothetical protein
LVGSANKSPDVRRVGDCRAQLILLLMRKGRLEDSGLEGLDFRQHLAAGVERLISRKRAEEPLEIVLPRFLMNSSLIP